MQKYGIAPLSQVCNLPKLALHKSIRIALFLALEGEEDYSEAPTVAYYLQLMYILHSFFCN